MSSINIRTSQNFLIVQCSLVPLLLVGLNIYLVYLKPNLKIISNSLSLCVQTILDNNKTYLSRKWIFDDNVFIVCDAEGKLNEWIKLIRNSLKFCQTLFIINDCSAEGEINKKQDALSELAFSCRHSNHFLWVLT